MRLSGFIFVLFMALTGYSFCQQYTVSGCIADKNTGSVLPYANVKVVGFSAGTSANKSGNYEIKLKKGKCLLSVSYLGYRSDTVSITLNENLTGIDFRLTPTNVNLPGITVLPGINPAIAVIANAIAAKKKREQKLLSYSVDSYTKGIVRTPSKLKAKEGRAAVEIAKTDDTSKMKIMGIVENQSKSYFKKPDKLKDIVIARKQTANFPPSVNVFTGGRFMENFYEERISLLDRPLTGPIANDAPDYYYYRIDDTLAMDNTNIFKIFITPDNADNPGFTGYLYITDVTFNLIKVELDVNRAANTGGMIDSLMIFQQFSSYADSIFMPTDYRLFVSLNLLNLARLSLEMNTIMYDYSLNEKIDDNFFNKAIITVLPEADKKDSVYWTKIQSIKSTSEETNAYKRIDSVEKAPKSFWSKFSFLSDRMNLSKTFSISSPLSMYHFNRVEGHALDFGMYLHNAFDDRFFASIKENYGFSDKRVKSSLGARYLFGDYRTYRLSFNAYNKLKVLYGDEDQYSEFTTTLLALLTKHEYNDYFYSKGFDFKFKGDIFPVLSLGIGAFSQTDKNAAVNSDFSFFYRDRKYSANRVIPEAKINALTASFDFDFRDYIEDGKFRQKIALGNSFMTFGGEVRYSSKKALKSDLDFTTYKLNSYAFLNTFRSASADLSVNAEYTDGALPLQYFYALPGNINALSKGKSFRTLDINEVYGDRVVTVCFDHDFKTELFYLSGIGFLKRMELQVNYFFNAAYTELGSKSAAIMDKLVKPKTFPHPFYETGFSIGHALMPFQLEFAWKLNYRGDNNFKVNIRSVVF